LKPLRAGEVSLSLSLGNLALEEEFPLGLLRFVDRVEFRDLLLLLVG
jgi:hypothetical protein